MAAVFGRAVALLSFVSISLSLSLASCCWIGCHKFRLPLVRGPLEPEIRHVDSFRNKTKEMRENSFMFGPLVVLPFRTTVISFVYGIFCSTLCRQKKFEIKIAFLFFFCFSILIRSELACVRCAHGRPEREMSKKLGYVRSPNGRFLPGDNRRLPRGEPVFLYLL